MSKINEVYDTVIEYLHCRKQFYDVRMKLEDRVRSVNECLNHSGQSEVEIGRGSGAWDIGFVDGTSVEIYGTGDYTEEADRPVLRRFPVEYLKYDVTGEDGEHTSAWYRLLKDEKTRLHSEEEKSKQSINEEKRLNEKGS